MPYFPTAQAWLEQSCLLLSARPTTTRITTKYTVSPPPKPKEKVAASAAEHAQPLQPKAYLTLKTYDPVSGACLKYKTDKAAEVGRLVASLGTCGRVMAALPDKAEKVEAMEGVEGGLPVTEEKGAKPASKDTKTKGGTTGGGGGGGGKKKKGKK